MKKLLIPILLFSAFQKVNAQADPYHNASGGTKTPVTRTIESFGAIADDGIDDSQAFELAADFFSNRGSVNINYAIQYGVLQLGSGTYIVGEQAINTNGDDIRTMHNTTLTNIDGLIIQGAGVGLTKVKTKPGAYWGFFAKSDITLNTGMYGKQPNSTGYVRNPAALNAETGWIFMFTASTKNILLKDIEMDGSSNTFHVGYRWENSGDFNTNAYGVFIGWASYVSLQNLYIHNFGEDGIMLQASKNLAAAGRWNVTMDSVRSLWNGRQALSWADGRDVKIENSTFAYTRLAEGSYDSDPNPIISQVAGSPGSNIDIEPGDTSSVIRNGVFNNCKILGNISPSASLIIQGNADSLIFNNCDIKASDNANPRAAVSWEAIGLEHALYRNFTFNVCNIVGTVNFQKYNEAALPNTGLTRFLSCSISNNNCQDPENRYDSYPILGLYDRVLFDKCIIKRTNKRPIFAVYNVDLSFHGIMNPDNYVTLNDCTISSSYERPWSENEADFPGRIYGLRFTGNTRFTHSPTVAPSRTNYNFLQEATLNGSSMYSPKNSFTFSNFDQFTGAISAWYFTPSVDINVYTRPIIIGETPCEYLDVYLGEGTLSNEFSAIRNDGRPFYIGEGVTFTVRKGAALVLSGDIYLAGKIVVEDGGYLFYVEANIHYLNTASAPPLSSILPPATGRPPGSIIWTNPNASVGYTLVPHYRRSELMAPNQYLRSAVVANRANYDDASIKCQQCLFNQSANMLECLSSRTVKLHPLNGIADADFYFPSSDDSGIEIYPNPTNDKVNISLNEMNKASEVQLLDINGRLLYRTTSKEGSEVEISLSKYPQGTYLIRISNENNTVVKKVVKVN